MFSESIKEILQKKLDDMRDQSDICTDQSNEQNNNTDEQDTQVIDDSLMEMLDIDTMDDDVLVNHVFDMVHKKIELIIERFPRVKSTLDENSNVKRMLSNKLSIKFAYTYQLTTMILLALTFAKINKNVDENV